MSRLIHYSAKPIGTLRRCLTQLHPTKPCGLWVSVEGEDDWFSWCISERFGTDRLVCQTEILLEPEANILRLSTEVEIDEFSDQYAYNEFPTVRAPRRYRFRDHVRWDRVADTYDGIIIAPYCWEARLASGTCWYYGWDCASGCIWNTDIARIGEVKVLEVTESIE